MANTIPVLSYANTFGDWVIATNALIVDHNVDAAGNLYAPTGTRFNIWGFDSANIANSFAFQTTNPTSTGTIITLPYASAQTAGYIAYTNPNVAGPASSIALQVVPSSSVARIASGAINSGTFLPLAFRTGGSDRVFISTSGNMGLGNSPSDPAGYRFLEIYGDAVNGGGLRTFTSAGGVDLRVQAQGSIGYVGTCNTAPVVFLQNNIERFRLDGTYINVSNQNYTQNKTDGTSPTMDITSIAAAGYAPPIFSLARWGASSTATPSGSAAGQIRFNGLDSSNGYANFGTIAVDIGTNAVGGAPADMVFYASSSGAAATERMRISGSGAVYIGGASSAASLKVNQVASSTRWVEISGSNGGSPTIKSSAGALQFGDGSFQSVMFAESNAVALDLKGRSTDGAAVMRFVNNAYTVTSGTITVFPGDGIVFGTAGTPTDVASQVKIAHVANAKNSIQLQGGPTGGGTFIGSISSTDTNVVTGIYSKGTGSVSLYTQGAASEEFRITNDGTTSTRAVTITGSAAANPKVSTTGGGLLLSGSNSNVTIDVNNSFNLAYGMTSGYGVSTGDVVFEHGSSRTANGNVYIDFHATPSTDYESRVLRLSGADGEFSFANKGIGNMVFDQQEAGNTVFKTNSIERMRIESTGAVKVTGTAYSPTITLTDGTYITWNTALGNVAQVTLGGNRTMNAATNLVNGGFYALAVIQNTGANTVTWNTAFKWAAQTAPTLSTAAGAKDFFVFRSDGTNLYEQGRSLSAY